MKRILLFYFLILSVACGAQANLYVDSSIAVSGAGASWVTAYKTLNEALNFVNGSSTTTKYIISVAKGTYYPTGVQSGANRDSAFVITRDGITLYGGYPSGGGTRNVSVNATVLSGNIGSAADNADNSYHVMIVAGISTTDSVTVDGFTFTKGEANGTGSSMINAVVIKRNCGGGVYVSSNSSSLIVFANCTVRENNAVSNGAGMYNEVDGANYAVNYCNFFNNQTISAGGGMYNEVLDINTASLSVNNCSFSGNVADTGGGICNVLVGPGINDCLFSGNLATGNGGAIYNYNGSCPHITNCTLAGDSALNGASLYNASSTATASSPVITNSIIWDGVNGIFNINNSTPVITYSIVQGGYAGMGNSSADPLFVNPVSANAAPDTSGNHSLQPCSPAINMGQMVATGLPTTDVAGNQRVYNNIVDMGAYEYQGVYPAPVTGDSGVCIHASIQLGNAIAGGTWTNNNVAIDTISATGMVTGIAAGMDTITYIATTGACTDTVTKVITINALPPLAIIKGDSNVCVNGTLALVATIAGGVWTSSNTALATINTTGGVVGLAAGTDTIHYTTFNAAGCTTVANKIIAIHPLPAVTPIMGDSIVCLNAAILLSDTTAGGTWSSKYPYIATVGSSGIVTGRVADQYPDTIFYTVVTNLGCSNRVAKAVNVDAPFADTAIGSFSYCFAYVGEPILLTNTVPNGTWSSSDPAIANIFDADTLIIHGAGSTLVSYTATDLLGCTNAEIIKFTFNPMYHTSTAHTICEGDQYYWGNQVYDVAGTYMHTFQAINGCDSVVTLTLNVQNISTFVSRSGYSLIAQQAGASYQWLDCSNNDAPINGETGQSFTATTDGSYAVRITINGCTVLSACNTVSLGVANVNGTSTDVQLYPNPTSGRLTINTGSIKASYILVKDLTGRTIQQIVPQGNITDLSLTDYVPGMYLVEVIYSDGERYTGKVNVIR